MIPFPGESLAVQDAWSSSGDDWTLVADIHYRGTYGTGDGHRVISAGTNWRAWAYAGDFDYLEESGAGLVMSWVVEVLSGTATLAVSDLVDPDFTYDTASPLPNALGSLSVAGAGTYVIPASVSGVEAADDDYGALVVDIECTSGSCDVQQVKLRAWPVGGAPGGWSSTLDGFNTTPALPSITGAPVNRDEVSGDDLPPEDAWDDTMALVAGGASAGGDGPHATSVLVTDTATSGSVSWRTANPGVSPYINIVTSLGGTVAVVTAAPHGVIVLLTGPDPLEELPIAPSLVEGVDWVRPPTEVDGDVLYYVQQDGTASVEWLNPYATIVLEASSADVDGGPSVHTESPSSSPILPGSLLDVDMVEGPAVVTLATTEQTGVASLPTTGRRIVAAVSHSMAFAAVPWPGLAPFSGSLGFDFIYAVHFGQGTPGPTFNPLQAYVALPPYRVWNPAAVALYPHQLIQRGDGLGFGSARVFDPGTRQFSGRVYGTY